MKPLTLSEIRADRIRLQDPYAHIDRLEEGGPARRTRTHSHSLASIEKAATDLLRDLWGNRKKFGLPPNADAFDVMNPRYAAHWLGFDYVTVSSLGHLAEGGRRVAAAGIIDRPNKRITVATDAGPQVLLFTAAHEIGHLVLHPNQTGLHRDLPISGPRSARNRAEYEADKFATFFLMPRKLLMTEFEARFLGRFTLNEDTAYALLGKPHHAARHDLPSRRAISRKLAGAIQYNGRTFRSLVERFGVSVEAMAIRLEELDLV